MLDNLIQELTKLKEEIDAIDINQIPEEQRFEFVNGLADKVLNTLDNANIPLPEEYPEDSGIEVPTSEL
jgi:ABC-type transporter Mla subunit MlaD